MKVDMKPRIYIETSIPSYLTSRRSRDLIAATNQELAQDVVSLPSRKVNRFKYINDKPQA